MSSQALRDARRYEEVFEQMIMPEERPAFHLSSRVGWMNDPNFHGIKGSTISFTNTTRTTRIGDPCTGDTP